MVNDFKLSFPKKLISFESLKQQKQSYYKRTTKSDTTRIICAPFIYQKAFSWFLQENYVKGKLNFYREIIIIEEE